MLLSTVSSIFGADILIAIVVPWFLVAIVGVLVLGRSRYTPLRRMYVPVLMTLMCLDAILHS